MALVYNSSGRSGDTWGSGTTITTAITVAAGSNIDGFYFVGQYDAATTGDKCTGATWNGNDMTMVCHFTADVESKHQAFSLWRYFGATAGTYNVVATFSESIAHIWGMAEAVANANQSSIDAYNSGTNTSGTPATISVTTVANNCWLIGCAWVRGSTEPSAYGANTYDRQNNLGVGLTLSDTNSAQTPAGAHTLSWNVDAGSSVTWMLAVSIAPYVAPSGPANLKTLNGLAKASVKTIDALAIASVKTFDGLT